MSASTAPAWVSFIHPAIAAVGLTLGFFAMRRGLVLRQARARNRPPPNGQGLAHVALARPGVILCVLSFGLGLLSAIFARQLKPFDSTHAWLGLVATLGFAGTGLIGTGLLKNRESRRGLHVGLSLVGMGFGLITALTGISMLP